MSTTSGISEGGAGSLRSRLALAFQATRPAYIPTSVLPGLVGVAVAINARGARWWLAPVAMVALGLAHAGTNAINDVEDFARGVDSADKLNNSRVFNTGLMSVPQGRALARSLFGCAFALGVGIAIVQGPVLFAIGVVGLGVGYGYTAGPEPLKYAGLGEAAIVFVMGPLITQGAYTAVTGTAFHAAAFWLGFGPGLLITAVLAANNLSDIPGDRTAGVRTLAVRRGFAAARVIYLAPLLLAYAVPVAVWAAGLMSWPVLIPLVTVPLALRFARQALRARSEGDATLPPLVPATAQLHLLFCLLLLIGVVIDRV